MLELLKLERLFVVHVDGSSSWTGRLSSVWPGLAGPLVVPAEYVFA